MNEEKSKPTKDELDEFIKNNPEYEAKRLRVIVEENKIEFDSRIFDHNKDKMCEAISETEEAINALKCRLAVALNIHKRKRSQRIEEFVKNYTKLELATIAVIMYHELTLH